MRSLLTITSISSGAAGEAGYHKTTVWACAGRHSGDEGGHRVSESSGEGVRRVERVCGEYYPESVCNLTGNAAASQETTSTMQELNHTIGSLAVSAHELRQLAVSLNESTHFFNL